ncbi:hypothetical protein BH11PLA2_BH11PLA2_46270 [soil metagenome]
MNTITTLALLLPLTGSFHPNTKQADCAPCNTPPMMPMMPGMMAPDINAGKPCPPVAAAQVLAAKVVVPDGVRITAMPGSPEAKNYMGSALFGLRPGYIFRFELSNIGGKADTVLYPEVEVRGTLVLRSSMKLMENYAGIAFTARDLDRAMAGAMITKVIYLEDPEKAVPVKTTMDQPFEIPEDTEQAAIKAAFENGRIVAVVRLGNRKPTAELLAMQAISGTVLMPGEQYLAAPAMPGPLAWAGVNLYDPILGPKYPHEECLTDGGDTGPRMGVRDSGVLGGLSPTDTAAEYTVGLKKKVVTSNTVCICAPRFVVRRVDVGLGGMQHYLAPNSGVQRFPINTVAVKQPPLIVIAKEKPQIAKASIHPQIRLGGQTPTTISGLIGPAKAIYVLQTLVQVTQSVEPEEVANADGFILVKDVDPKTNVKVGDEVTFTLTYTNRTGKPVTDVVVSDSLSGRLEYIPGTSQSDRPVNVTTSANEAGSVVVRFEVPGTLQPGQGGVVKFKAKVR